MGEGDVGQELACPSMVGLSWHCCGMGAPHTRGSGGRCHGYGDGSDSRSCVIKSGVGLDGATRHA
jgi:hypothetical protein